MNKRQCSPPQPAPPLVDCAALVYPRIPRGRNREQGPRLTQAPADFRRARGRLQFCIADEAVSDEAVCSVRSFVTDREVSASGKASSAVAARRGTGFSGATFAFTFWAWLVAKRQGVREACCDFVTSFAVSLVRRAGSSSNCFAF